MQPYLRDGVLDDLLVSHIALVTYKQLVDAVGGVTVDLLEPLLDVVERIHVGNIIDDADTVSATVVRARDSPEAFLARSVPLVAVSAMSGASRAGELTI